MRCTSRRANREQKMAIDFKAMLEASAKPVDGVIERDGLHIVKNRGLLYGFAFKSDAVRALAYTDEQFNALAPCGLV
jgi:hypothetical protein